MVQHQQTVEARTDDVCRTFVPSFDDFADADLRNERIVPRILGEFKEMISTSVKTKRTKRQTDLYWNRTSSHREEFQHSES